MVFNSASLVHQSFSKSPMRSTGQALDKGLKTDVIYLDSAKAFGLVSATLCMSKIASYENGVLWYARYTIKMM